MVEKLVIGEKIEGKVVILKSLKNQSCEITDKSGVVVNGHIIPPTDEGLVGKAVTITAVVKPGQNRQPFLNIKKIALAEKSEYKPSELFDGLSKEVIDNYKKTITSAITAIKNPQLKALVEKCLTEENLQMMQIRPATLSKHGVYSGGALAATAIVTMFTRDIGVRYVTNANGLVEQKVDWSLLLSGALLHCLGSIEYYTDEEPFEKTEKGVYLGYHSCLQTMLLKASEDIEIADETLYKLFNIIQSACGKGVRATSKEGIILRHCINMYSEMDAFDYGVAEKNVPYEEGERSYYYDQSMNRFIIKEKGGTVNERVS